MDKCYFAKKPPEVEVGENHIFIRNAIGEIAYEPQTLQRFVARINQALAEWHGRKCEVVPFKRRKTG